MIAAFIMHLAFVVREQQKEIAALREAKEQQIEDLRKMADEAKLSTQNELEKKVNGILYGMFDTTA